MVLAGLGQPQNHRGDLVVAYDHCGPLNPDPSEALPSPPGAQAKEERGAALGVWESVGAVQSGLRLTLRFPVVNSECSLQRMPAAMEKRKENLVSGTVIGGERLGPTKKVFKTRPLTKKKAQAKAKLKVLADAGEAGGGVAVADRSGVQWRPQAEQAEWLTSTFHSLFGALLSPAEKEPLPDDRIVELSEEIDRSTEKLGSRVKAVIGPVWKEFLCNVDKTGDAGSPVVLVLCSSAIRCVELLRGMRAFIGKVKPAKLFAKHIKVEEQVTLLKEHVNIAAGTPNRVRKLIDIGAMGTGRLRLVILDMHADAKGLTILSVPQVMAEFWELYRAHFHQVFLAKQAQLFLY